MSHDDPGAKDATKKPPERGGSFLRAGSFRSIARIRARWAAFSLAAAVLLCEMRALAIFLLLLVVGLVECKKYEFAFGPSSGSVHFEGSDPMGAFSGDVSAWNCQGRFAEESTSVYFSGTRRSDMIGVGDDGGSVNVRTRGGEWTLERSACRAFDVRKWFDAEKHFHVLVLVDCTSAEGVRVQGSVRSDACYIKRPG